MHRFAVRCLLLMNPRPSTVEPDRNSLLTALVIGLGFTLALTALAALWERDTLAATLRDLASERLDKLDATLLGSTEVLYALRDVRVALSTLDEARFRVFADDAIRRHPSLQAIEWIPRLLHADRAALEHERWRAGYPEFLLTEIGFDGGLTHAGTRAEYYPVTLVAPVAGNLAAMGMDLAHHPHRRDALLRARDSGLPAATAPVKLAQEPERQSGFLLFVPVYDGAPANVIERRAAICGFALAVFRAGDLMDAAFRDLPQRGIRVRVVDQAAPDLVLFDTGLFDTGLFGAGSQSAPTSRLALDWHSTRHFAGREWQFTFRPDAGFLRHEAPLRTLAAFAIGLLLTALLAGYVALSARRTREVRSANAALVEEVRERERAEREATAANQVKSEFLASMSHEIRTPMNAVLGHAQWLLGDAGLTRDQRVSVNAIVAGGSHLLAHINDVLDLSRIEAGRIELRHDVIELNELLREIETLFRARAEEKRLTLKLGFLPTPQRVECDACKLRQILINLVGNALRFTRVGEVYLGVKRTDDNTGGLATRFDVIDTGPGIAADELARVFEPFYQSAIRTSSPGEPGGSGLGLAIAARLAALMKGRIDVVSELGAGTRFSLTLPLAAPTENAQATPAPSGWRCLEPQVSVVAVLDADGAEVLARLLDRLGIATRICTPDSLPPPVCRVLFVDPGQPPRFDLAALIADLPTMTRVVVMTTQTHTTPPPGCAAHLTKPLALAALVACLESVAGWRFEALYVTADDDIPPRLPEWSRLALPEALLTRLVTAAELHSTTALKSALAELRSLGTEEALLAAHLQHHLRAYDMHAIARLLARLPSAPATSPSAPSSRTMPATPLQPPPPTDV